MEQIINIAVDAKLQEFKASLGMQGLTGWDLSEVEIGIDRFRGWS